MDLCRGSRIRTRLPSEAFPPESNGNFGGYYLLTQRLSAHILSCADLCAPNNSHQAHIPSQTSQQSAKGKACVVVCSRCLLSILLHTRQVIPAFIQSFFHLQTFFVCRHIRRSSVGRLFNESRVVLDLDPTLVQPLTIPESDALDSL